MNPTWAFFSLQGRMRRRDYWLWNIVLGMIQWPAMMYIFQGGTGALSILASIVMFISTWSNLAMDIKRLRDRDMPPWWIGMSLLPLTNILPLILVSAVFRLVVLGILDGTPGPNRYGPDPKGRGGKPPSNDSKPKDEAVFEG
ncbi:hypothetical protein CS022_01425 [Veronia nyctiphanis]|uniref:DUF805 domain-containing protein n=1 Tax=Veronia nyctiphanis TaxID=1278244 RepID=A0A4V1LTE2_9GAMM|nr:DUF805 domain-containing protein [Veronia nyctiphanis]RXJ74888.1 hypothetical protein CS022_01425 [Veronia nyctiphanis]